MMKRLLLNHRLLSSLRLSFPLRQIQRSYFCTETQEFLQFDFAPTPADSLLSIESIHSNFLKSGILLNDAILTKYVMNSYARLREISNARHLLDEMPESNVVSWSSLMASYVNTGQPRMALHLFLKMLRNEVLPNAFTLSTLISACFELGDAVAGKTLHAHVELHGYQTNLEVCNALIDFYGKTNDMASARQVFYTMEERDIVSWSSMVSAYVRNGLVYEALQIFDGFNGESIGPPNEYMLSSVIAPRPTVGRLANGEAVHSSIIKLGYESNDVVSCTLLFMYAKSGCIGYSIRVFEGIQNPSMIHYNSVIDSAAKHGLSDLSFELFHQMLEKRVRPNDITFVSLLRACSHSGKVDTGLEYLNSMHTKYGVLPAAMHYACVVDMLGCVGRLEEAYEIAKSAQVQGDEVVRLWCSLLSACRLQGRVDIAAKACKYLLETKQLVAAPYINMASAYALVGN